MNSEPFLIMNNEPFFIMNIGPFFDYEQQTLFSIMNSEPYE